MPDNVTWHEGRVELADRERLLGQKSAVLWMSGLSGSGKSTIARETEQRLFSMEKLAYVLDGDNLRHGLNSDLGFSSKDRSENLRRVAEIARLLSDLGTIVIVATISPTVASRDRARKIVGSDRFHEIWVATSLEECERRDPKGLYARARAGEIENFTGVSAPYETPHRPDLVLQTEGVDSSSAAYALVDYLRSRGIV